MAQIFKCDMCGEVVNRDSTWMMTLEPPIDDDYSDTEEYDICKNCIAAVRSMLD